MRSPRWRKVLRDVWLHKARTLLVVLAIAVGIVGAGAVLNTWSLMRRVTREGYLATNPPSATLRTDSVDDALLARVRAHPAVGDAQARRRVVARAQVQGAWRTAILFAAPDFTDLRMGAVQALEGVWPPTDSAAVIERSSLEFAGASVGAPIMLQIGDGEPVALPVGGIARDAGLAPGWMENVVYVFVAPATLARLGASPAFDLVQIRVADASLGREEIRRIAYEVKAAIEATGRRVTDVEVPEPGEHIHAPQIDSLLFTQGAFGLLALLLSGFLVVNLVAGIMAGQVREIGVMKTVGARSGQVAALFLAMALVLGIAASAVAIPAAAVLGRGYAQFTSDLLNFDMAGFEIPRWSFALQLAVGLLLPLAAAAIPVSRGCRIPVGAALRDFGIDPASDGGSGRWLHRAGGLSRPFLLSLRNAFRRRQRMALTLATLSLGGAVYLGALNLRASIRDSVGVLYEEVLRFDLSLRVAAPALPDRLEAAVAARPGVAAAEAWNGARAAVAHPNGSLGNAFPVTGQPAESPMVAYPVEAGRWLRPGDTNALVASRSLVKDEPGLAIGAEVTLVIDGRPSRWTLVGVVSAMPSPAAFTTRDALARVTGEPRASTVVVRAADRDPATHGTFIRRLRADLERDGLPVASGQLLSEGRKAVEDHLLMVAGFLLVMSQLMIVVGGLGLASTMSLSVLERTREIGILRAIGARHGAIHALVQGEGMVISLLSWLVAIPLSVPVSAVLGVAFGRVMMRVPVSMVPNPAAVVQWLLVVAVVSVAACAWPALRATRVTTSRALAYE